MGSDSLIWYDRWIKSLNPLGQNDGLTNQFLVLFLQFYYFLFVLF